jgi:hypothetical protein
MKNNIEHPAQFRTADLYLAAYLKCAGVVLADTVREGSRVYFYFEGTPSIPDLKHQYFNRQSKVAALSYADEIRSMKSLTHST